jgi:hypothetical protein
VNAAALAWLNGVSVYADAAGPGCHVVFDGRHPSRHHSHAAQRVRVRPRNKVVEREARRSEPIAADAVFGPGIAAEQRTPGVDPTPMQYASRGVMTIEIPDVVEQAFGGPVPRHAYWAELVPDHSDRSIGGVR